MSTNLISQAAEMRSHGIPNDLLPTLNSVAVVVFLPILQHVVNPFLRQIRLPFPPVHRMLVGFTVEAAAMAYVAGVQKLIYSRGPCFHQPRHCPASKDGQIPNDVHSLIQLPVYILEGIGETFSNPAGYEYSYTKAPGSMKSVVQAAFQLSSAGGSALALALAPTYKDPEILVMYSSLAGCMFLDAIGFYALHRKYNKNRKK
jgi:proton-dependent oligopeptide transporter, POT family